MKYPKGVLKRIELERKLKESPGYNINLQIAQFQLTTYIFQKNFEDLMKHMESQTSSDNASRLSQSRNREELRFIQMETVRLLHNFISSVSSLIDHTRKFVEKLHATEEVFFKEYNAKIRENFQENPLAGFIKDLRNYFLHYQIPSIATVTDLLVDNPQENSKIVINKTELLKYSGWKSPAKQFINKTEQHVNLEKVVKDYQELVRNFYHWFEKRQTEVHVEEFSEMKNIMKELQLTNHYISLNDFIDGKCTREYFLQKIDRCFSAMIKDMFSKLSIEKQAEYIITMFEQNNFSLDKSEIHLFKARFIMHQ